MKEIEIVDPNEEKTGKHTGASDKANEAEESDKDSHSHSCKKDKVKIISINPPVNNNLKGMVIDDHKLIKLGKFNF